MNDDHDDLETAIRMIEAVVLLIVIFLLAGAALLAIN